MDIHITTLIENTASVGFMAEWGLSILIESDGSRILLDTGPGISTIYNASLLGIDFKTIDRVVLSHGHYDHTGGLKEILRRSSGLDIISYPDIWGHKYSIREGKAKYIGIPFYREEMESLGARFKMSKEPVYIADNILTSGEIPFVTGYEETDHDLYIKERDGFKNDNFPDDLSLAIKTEKGLAIFLGCAHRGMINTIRQFQKITGDELVYSVVGGTHLISASSERLAKTIDDLKKTGIKKLGVSHCTGFEASARLAAEFKDIFFLNYAGSRHKLL
ncbi:MAG TPA: MBL fold metallo-hydrolase [Desulfatiglandales bacterium]|nr:MBL fold metallo-hydrolase [Desulfatiglandales bacterium]